MSRLVSLAMYDPGDGAVDRLWAALRPELAAEIDDVPAELAHAEDLESAWLSEDLLLAQTCGYPLRHRLDGRVRYVGTPVYEVEGVEGPLYRSALVVRTGDPAQELAELRGRRAAFNSTTSQSGYNAFRHAVSPLAVDGRFFGTTLETGSHAASLRAVLEGRADVAAIDPVSLALAPEATRRELRTIGWTAPTPGLPVISALGVSDDLIASLRSGLTHFIRPATETVRSAFHLVGFEVLDEADYDAILAMEHAAIDRSYPALN